MSRLKLGIQKGALQTRRRPFYRVPAGRSRGLANYVPAIDDAEIECLLVREQEEGALR